MEKQKQKMTLHRALSELKLIDSKITKQITDIIPVGLAQKGKLVNGQFKQDEFEKSAQSKFQSVNDLIERKSEIKSAIVIANSETKVKVAGVEMTIAQAINKKNSIELKKALAKHMKDVYVRTTGALNKNNETVNGNLQKLLEASFGKDNVKSDSEDVTAISKPFLEQNAFHLIDPLEINKKLEAIETEISQFEADVDSALSEVNAVTFIEI